MKNQLKIEETAQFLLILFLFIFNDAPWWVYLLLVLGPDIGMLGYLAGPRAGAFTYNLFHHKGVALLLVFIGAYWGFLDQVGDAPAGSHPLLPAGLILYGHASMDRIFGYGLKYSDHFKHTHLGWIGGVALVPGKEADQ